MRRQMFTVKLVRISGSGHATVSTVRTETKREALAQIPSNAKFIQKLKGIQGKTWVVHLSSK